MDFVVTSERRENSVFWIEGLIMEKYTKVEKRKKFTFRHVKFPISWKAASK